MSLKSIFKGFVGEAFGSLSHKLLLDNGVYCELNNVTILTQGGTTQIDHVIVSRFGIFVIEAKNMNGWIFGNEKSAQWTQSFPGGKFRFQNPLRQNYRHTKCLSEFLDVKLDKFHSVVMFWGESTFKTTMPENVLDKGYASYIKSKTKVLFSSDEVGQIVNAIQTGKLPATWATRRQHIDSLKERHSKPETSPGSLNSGNPICPLCSGAMIKRTAKRGSNAGKEFWGCSHYPDCKGIVNIQARYS
jgi:restriction system protein